ncbi:alanyl-tRNA editing protein Aarsd1-like isoform X2 [Bolinopsis microptera]|uniref:alanyl-tRNA editing protein Aarsd1-like isoform X2 n=1 Tax=Bolinopsis microptera TaxID=2820187 RepID=UPI00307AB382
MLLKCQKEPFLQQLTSKVVSCNEVKKGKKKHYEVVLEDTILFAEGGGQPCDHGVLRIVPTDVTDVDKLSLQNVKVVDVQRRDGRAVHFTDKRVGEGSEVNVEVNWKRRYDHMQQHTGQHLLSAIAEQEPYKYNTVSWNLGLTISHVELKTPSLSDEIKLEIEQKVNSLIQAGTPVITKVYDSKDDDALSSAHTRGLPADHSGPVRVIEIKGVDENMCCGTHLSSLAQLQMIKLLHTESKKGNTLLYFVCGDRVINTLQSALEVQHKLNVLLSSPPEKFAPMVEKLNKDNRTSRKTAEKLSEELAILHAASLLQSSERVLTMHRPSPDEKYSLTLQRDLRDTCEKRLLLLTMGELGGAQFVFRGPVDVVDKLGKGLAQKLGGKGGGRDGKFQGKFSDLALLESAVQYLRDNFES